MKAKKTTAAAEKTPITPKLEGVKPNMIWASGAASPSPPLLGSDGGTKGL